MERVRWIAEVQDGPISRPQLLACGMSNSKLGRLASSGWLIRLFSGVYALGDGAMSERGHLVAPLLYAGPGSALSHETAAFMRKLLDQEPSRIHLSCAGKCRTAPGLVIHRPKDFAWEMFDGLPLTTTAQTLVDISSSRSDREIRKALANAQYRSELDAESLQAVMGRGRPGSARLRSAIRRHTPELAETLSPLEDMLLMLCERYGVPLPRPNSRVGNLRPDAVWPEAMLIVEMDGGDAHSSPSQRRADAERDMYLRSLGFLVLRYTYWQARREGAAIAAELRTTIAARSSVLR